MTSTATLPARRPPSLPRRATGTSDLTWLAIATVVVVLNETAMLNALPSLMLDLGVSARAGQWLSTAFMLTMAVVIPATGWFLQRVTARTALRTAMTTFGAGTLLCALAPTYAVLVTGRVVQACGTAVMMPLLMTTLMRVVPADQRGRVMGRVTMAIAIAPALGPSVSGLVLGFASWRWIFGFVLLAAAVVTVLALQRLTVDQPATPTPLDLPSLVLVAVGSGPLVGATSLMGTGAGALALVPLAVGALGLTLFARRQLRLQRADRALLDLRTLVHRSYRLGVAIVAFGFMMFVGMLILLQLHLQGERGLSALQSGLLVLPGGAVMGLLGPHVGRLSDRLGARRLVLPGSVVTLGAVLALSCMAHVPLVVVLGCHVLMAVGLAAVYTPVLGLALGALPPRLYSHGSSLLAAVQQLAGAVGTALAISVLAWASQHAPGEALRIAVLVDAALALVVVGLALALPRALRTTPGQRR